MAKSFTQFLEESTALLIDEEAIVELVNELTEELDLTEEESQEVLDELFGIGATIKNSAAKIAHPIRKVGAALSGYKDRVKDAVHTAKLKSRAGDMKAAGKLAKDSSQRASERKDTYDKARGQTSVVKRSQDRTTRQAGIRAKKAGGGTTSGGQPYVTHNGKRHFITKAQAGAIGTGKLKASDVVKPPKAPKPTATTKPKASPKP